jgi:transcriptional/translational regulatory protein YebC/TACO1
MFTKKGYILVEKSKTDEDSLMAAALEAGAEDMKNDPKEESYEIISSPEDMARIKEVLESSGIPISLAEITMLPTTYITLDDEQAEQMLKLVDVLEDNDDIQNVYTNFDIPEDVVTKVGR